MHLPYILIAAVFLVVANAAVVPVVELGEEELQQEPVAEQYENGELVRTKRGLLLAKGLLAKKALLIGGGLIGAKAIGAKAIGVGLIGAKIHKTKSQGGWGGGSSSGGYGGYGGYESYGGHGGYEGYGGYGGYGGGHEYSGRSVVYETYEQPSYYSGWNSEPSYYGGGSHYSSW